MRGSTAPRRATGLAAAQGLVLARTQRGIGVGIVSEWVAHNTSRGSGALETVLALPFLTLNLILTITNPPRKAPHALANPTVKPNRRHQN